MSKRESRSQQQYSGQNLIAYDAKLCNESKLFKREAKVEDLLNKNDKISNFVKISKMAAMRCKASYHVGW